MLPAGTILDGRYEILEPLAVGGMGAVFRARRRLLGDDVALKMVRGGLGAQLDARERFLRESQACAQLRHPNIVSILDFNLDAEGRPFMVMELLNGRSLREEIERRAPFAVSEVQDIIVPLCGALQLAHDRGILHRDLKPANVVAHDFGGGSARVYKIVDFGLVRELKSDSTRLTESHQFVGTFAYASPEQMTSAEMDPRSDQYSLAVVAYEMLTGRPPFTHEDPGQLLTALVTQPVKPPSDLRPDLPAWVDLVLSRALAKSPADRYESMTAFGRALQSGDSGGRTTVVLLRASRYGGQVMGGVTPSGGGLLATYELGESVGSGRLGSEVFRGTHRALGHPVAIRLLRRSEDRDWDAVRARFLREARMLQIPHPSIIQVRDYGEEGDLVYLVTDFIDGPSIRQVLAREGAQPWPRLRPLLAQLIDAARTLHRREGFLCGLNPDIMRLANDEDGDRLMISTAGIWQAQDLLTTLADATLRGSAMTDVEPPYVAPELLTGQHADVRSDVFTMGVIAYELATGTRPFDGGSLPALLGAMLRAKPADPRERQLTLPGPAAAAILSALAADPDARPQTAKAFGAAMAL